MTLACCDIDLSQKYIWGPLVLSDSIIKAKIDNQIDELSQSRLLELVNGWYDIGETDESERLLRFLLAKFPDYEPAKRLERGKVIERFVTYRLAQDPRQDAAELELYEGYGADRDTNIVLGTHRLARGDAVEGSRYMQQANNAMTSEQMQLYVMVFLGYFQQIQVWDRYDVIDRDDETLWSISPLNQKLLKRRLAYQTGLDDVQSETQFEIEALRGEDEPLEDEELVELFVRAFGTYYNFWDAYFGEEQEELEEG